jgi:hypothetical protein
MGGAVAHRPVDGTASHTGRRATCSGSSAPGDPTRIRSRICAGLGRSGTRSGRTRQAASTSTRSATSRRTGCARPTGATGSASPR